jgi:signal transduction histidine kinase
VRSLDEIVWAVRPQNDNLPSLVEYLGYAARSLCEGSDVRCWFSGLPTVPALEVSAMVRHNLLLAYREVINNVLKHSGATEVHVRLRLEADGFTVEVADNGHGFEVANGEARRSGLLHIRQRLAEIGGRGTWHANPGNWQRRARHPSNAATRVAQSDQPSAVVPAGRALRHYDGAGLCHYRASTVVCAGRGRQGQGTPSPAPTDGG